MYGWLCSKTSRETLLKTDSIKFDSTGDYIVTAVSNDASISDDETSSSCDNDYDGAHSILDEVDNRIIESWDWLDLSSLLHWNKTKLLL